MVIAANLDPLQLMLDDLLIGQRLDEVSVVQCDSYKDHLAKSAKKIEIQLVEEKHTHTRTRYIVINLTKNLMNNFDLCIKNIFWRIRNFNGELASGELRRVDDFNFFVLHATSY